MAILSGRTDFDDLSFGINTSIVKGTDIFTLGDGYFSIQTNLEDRNIRDLKSKINSFSEPVTLDNLNINEVNIKGIIQKTELASLNDDKSKLTNFAYFGSLKEFIKNSINSIISKFPASVFVTSELNDIKLTVLDYTYDNFTNVSSFKIPVSALENNYNLIYTDKSFLFTESDDIKDISSNYLNYQIWDFDVNYDIINFTGSTDSSSGYIYLNVQGNPFPSEGVNFLKHFHIKPKYSTYVGFLNGLNDFEAYLLNRDGIPRYTAVFKELIESEDGENIFVDKFFTWKTTDGYNLDLKTFEYEDYYNSLLKLGEDYDNYKTDIISRMLTTTSLKEFDTPDGKADKLLKIYGKEFDEIKRFIDGLAYANRVTYDKKDNIPDIMVKNLARTLGWGVINTVTDDDLINSFIGDDSTNIFSGQSKNLTPVETDIELWRRLVINSAYLFKSKGTRSCIEFLFKIIGAPKSLIEFNEYVYLVDEKIDTSVVENNSELNYPFDNEGYPITLPNTSDYYFQMKGGWRETVDIAPTNGDSSKAAVGIHQGDYDNGKLYFDIFQKFGDQKGFNLSRVVDNIKSWKFETGFTKRVDGDRGTNYSFNSSKLILNSKEASIFLNPANAIEYDVYDFNQKSDYVINATGLPSPYPDNKLTQNEISDLSFIEYVDLVYSNFINAKNRKVATDNRGGGYPTLQKLYEDYYENSTLKLNLDKVSKYIKIIDGFWLQLIDQFVPSTTIWDGGTKYSNTIFNRQKFVYKQGVNDGSEFATEQIENNVINIYGIQINGSATEGSVGTISNNISAVGSYIASMSFPEETTPDNINRNILRVSEFITGMTFTYNEPPFYVSGATKIITGHTSEQFNVSIAATGKTLGFIFSGDTSILDTSEFKYKIYQYSFDDEEFNSSYVYSGMTDTFITSGSVKMFNDILPASLNSGDYLIKGFFRFTGGTINDYGYNFTNVPFIIDTEALNNSQYYTYGLYDNSRDYWFTILSNPESPIIKVGNFEIKTGVTDFGDSVMKNVSLTVTVEDQTEFLINEIPAGKIFVTVNGNLISESVDADFSDGKEYFTEIVSGNLIIKLANGLSIINEDILNIVYLTGGNGDNTIISEAQIITTIPSGTTGTRGGKIFYNTTISKYEYYFDFVLTPEKLDSIVVSLNGQTLLKGTDYYLPATENCKIIFESSVSIGDVLTFYYPSSWLDVQYYMTSRPFIAEWSMDTGNYEGLFTIEITSESDSTFSSVLHTASTIFVDDMTDYSLYITDITEQNSTFLYRIKADKYYYNLLDEKIVTTSYSDILKFKTDNRVSAYE